MAWLIVSTSAAVKGGQSQTAQFSHATTQFPWWIHPAFRAGGQSHGPGYRAAVFSALPGQQRGTPRARARDGQQGAQAHGTPGRALPPAANVIPPPSSAVQKTARVSSTHVCSPLQSLCELLARGPLENSRVLASGH